MKAVDRHLARRRQLKVDYAVETLIGWVDENEDSPVAQDLYEVLYRFQRLAVVRSRK